MTYKTVKNIFVLSFTFWIYSLLGVSTYATEPLVYYQKLFETFNIKTSIVGNVDNKPQLEEDNEIRMTVDNLLNDDDPNRSNFLLLFSSQANLIDLINDNPFNIIIIICDSQYELKNNDSCDANNINKNYENSKLLKLGEYNWYKGEVSILQDEVEDKKIYLIPQRILITPAFTKDAETFFNSLNNSQETLTKYQGGKRRRLIEHLNPILLSSIAYFVVTAIFIRLCWKLISLNTKPLNQILTLKFLSSTLQKLALELSRYRKSLILIISIGLFIPTALVVLVKLLPYAFPQSAPFLLFDNIRTTLGAKMELAMAMITILGLYLIIMTTSITLLLIPIFIRLITDLNLNVKTKYSTSKHILIVLLFLSIVSTLYVRSTNQTYIVTNGLLILAAYFYYALTRDPSKKLFFYTRRERIVYTLVLFTLISFIILYSMQLIHINQRYKYEKLLNDNTRIIPLPYYKDFDSDRLFETFYFDESFPLFVNEYMIYHPNFKYINLVPLKDFSINNEKNFYVILKDDYSLLQDAINIPKLDEFITGKEFSKYFYFNNAEFDINKQYIFNITISCRESSIKPTYISLSYKNDARMENFNITRLLNFPGCIKGEDVRFQVPTNAKHLKNKILYKVDQLNDNIEAFSLTENGVDVEMKNIVKIDKNKLYVAKEVKTTAEDTITVYLPTLRENQKPIRFDTSPKTGKKDISDPINNLIQLGKLKDQFIIWSNIENSFIELSKE